MKDMTNSRAYEIANRVCSACWWLVMGFCIGAAV